MLKCSKNGCFIRNLQQNGHQAMDKQQEMSNESQKPCKHWIYKSEVLTPRSRSAIKSATSNDQPTNIF